MPRLMAKPSLGEVREMVSLSLVQVGMLLVCVGNVQYSLRLSHVYGLKPALLQSLLLQRLANPDSLFSCMQ